MSLARSAWMRTKNWWASQTGQMVATDVVGLITTGPIAGRENRSILLLVVNSGRLTGGSSCMVVPDTACRASLIFGPGRSDRLTAGVRNINY